jgi:hypothetical protein
LIWKESGAFAPGEEQIPKSMLQFFYFLSRIERSRGSRKKKHADKIDIYLDKGINKVAIVKLLDV